MFPQVSFLFSMYIMDFIGGKVNLATGVTVNKHRQVLALNAVITVSAEYSYNNS